MHDPVPSCFRGGAAGAPPASTAAGPSMATSVYETHLGLASLSWSRTVLGLSLSLHLRLDSEDPAAESLRFRIRPWIFWKRRGSRRLHLKDHPRHRFLDLAWDLSRARFPPCGGPEPFSHFFVAIVLDGEMLLVAGDLVDEAHRKIKARRPSQGIATPTLISRREHVDLKDSGGGARMYTTTARVGGREHEVAIKLAPRGGQEREPGLWVTLDGTRVVHVRRIRWKFRGSERVETEDGGHVLVSWDLHKWLFPAVKDGPPPPSAARGASELGRAVFVFRFETGTEPEGHSWKEKENFSEELKGVYKGIGGSFGKTRNWSESSSAGGGGERRGKGRKRSLLKTSSSSSSTSSASSGSSSTVMEWASPEEAQLRSAEGFSLLVYAWKS